jgi:hypothetical protein
MEDYKGVMNEADGVHEALKDAVAQNDLAKFTRLVEAHPAVALRQNDDPKGVAQPDVPEEFQAVLEKAKAKVDPDKLQAWQAADKATKNAWLMARFIESLRVDNKAGHIDTQTITGQERTVTDVDKKQLRDAIYGTLQGVSEEALKRAKAAGVE